MKNPSNNKYLARYLETIHHGKYSVLMLWSGDICVSWYSTFVNFDDIKSRQDIYNAGELHRYVLSKEEAMELANLWLADNRTIEAYLDSIAQDAVIRDEADAEVERLLK